MDEHAVCPGPVSQPTRNETPADIADAQNGEQEGSTAFVNAQQDGILNNVHEWCEETCGTDKSNWIFAELNCQSQENVWDLQ